jgi:hypothetical protein
LRQAIAVVGMFVGDQDTVNVIDILFNGCYPGQSFAFAETTIHQEAGSPGFEQRDVARTAGRQDGNAKAYRSFSKMLNSRLEIVHREFLR